MIASTVELVMFGIQAALRLNDQYRRAYADATLDRPITLPLPDFPSTPDVATAKDFYRFGDGIIFIQELDEEGKKNSLCHARVVELLEKSSLTDNDKQQLLSLYSEHKALLAAQADSFLGKGVSPTGLSNEDLLHLLTIRQWARGQNPNPSPLQRMAGTIINLAAGFLVQMPGVISSSSPKSRALRGFLEAIESIDFSIEGREEIVTGLFTAALETIRDVPELLTGNEKAQTLVKNVATGLFKDVKDRIEKEAGNLSAQDEIKCWGQFVLRSVISSAGTTIFEAPDVYLGIGGAAEGELVQRVSKELLGAILEEDKVSLKNLLTQEGLNRIAKAAIAVVGDHPELLHIPNAGLQDLIRETASALAQSSTRLGKDFLPEAIRLLLEKTACNFETLLPEGWNQPAKHLLVIAAKNFLEQLSSPPPADAPWKLAFGSREALHLVDIVMDEVVQNPSWLLDDAHNISPFLGDVTKAILDTLRASAPPRLSRQTALAILEASLRATGKRLEFMETDPDNRKLISLALDAIFKTVFAPDMDAKAAWVLARDATLQRMVEISLEKLVVAGVDPARIEKLRGVVTDAVQSLSRGEVWSLTTYSKKLEMAFAA